MSENWRGSSKSKEMDADGNHTGCERRQEPSDQSAAVNRRRRTMKHSSALTARNSVYHASYSTLANNDSAESEATPNNAELKQADAVGNPSKLIAPSFGRGSVRMRETTSANLLSEHESLDYRSSDGPWTKFSGSGRKQSSQTQVQSRSTFRDAPSVDSEPLSIALSYRHDGRADMPSIAASHDDPAVQSNHTETAVCDLHFDGRPAPAENHYHHQYQHQYQHPRSHARPPARRTMTLVPDSNIDEDTRERKARLSVGHPHRPLELHLSAQFVQLRDVGVMTDVADMKRSLSAARLADINQLSNISFEVMRLCGAVPGFRQLQKVSSSESADKAPSRTRVGAIGATKSADSGGQSTSRSSSKKRFMLKQLSAPEKPPQIEVVCSGPQTAADTLVSVDNNRTLLRPDNVISTDKLDTECLVADETRKSGVGFRLGRRRTLYEKRRNLADYSLITAIVGILLTVAETEFTMADIYCKQSIWSLGLKLTISLSTALLLALVVAYHTVEVQLFSIDNGIEDWRVAINMKRLARLVLELAICAIHPVPFTGTFTWVVILITGERSEREVSVDAILALPMFLRLYLVFRVLLLHSKIFTDASSRSIGALNRIKFNIRFVLKTMMTICPGTLLLVLILTLLLVSSWTIRLCESYHERKYISIFNSLWFVSITFLSIGYGDIVPSSACGRLIAIITGIVGSGCMALVVAVVATKLELSRAEKHVHNFMLDTQLTKQLKNAAANVLRETWLIYKYTKLAKKINASKVRAHQRCFLEAIQELRRVKLAQRKLTDNSMRLADLPKLHHQLHDIMADARQDQQSISDHVHQLEDRLLSLEKHIDEMPRRVLDLFLPQLQRIMLTPSPSPTPMLLTSNLSPNMLPSSTITPTRSVGTNQALQSFVVSSAAVLDKVIGSDWSATRTDLVDMDKRKAQIEAMTQTTLPDSNASHSRSSASHQASHETIADGYGASTGIGVSVTETGSLKRLLHADGLSNAFSAVAVPKLASAENSCVSFGVSGASASASASMADRRLHSVDSKASVVASSRCKIAECPCQFRSFSQA